MTPRPDRRLVVVGVLAHLLVTTFVWRDIARRSPADLRGSKALWRSLTAANTTNSVIYLLVGRRHLP